MDLSGLKWPLIILVVVGLGWLASSGGVNYMVTNFTKATPGQDANRDKIDEDGLTRVGGYLMYLFRYERAAAVMQLSIDRYGTAGASYWYNRYRIAKCMEKMGNYQECYNILSELADLNAQQYDDRVASADILRGKAAKIKEVNGLP